MSYKTKFTPLDVIWFMMNNKAVSMVVWGLDVVVRMVETGDGVEEQIEEIYFVSKHIKDNRITVNGCRAYRTKQELLESL